MKVREPGQNQCKPTGRNVQESAGKYFKMVWACIEKRRRRCGQEIDGDRGAVEEKERKSEAQVVG